jgi:PDZ domain-containing protein
LIQPATKKKFRLRPDLVIACLLLLIPVGVGIYCFIPQYSYFTAMGEIVPVQEVGVQGSVNFTYVNEGFTTNLYERWTTTQAFPDAQFEAADASYNDYLSMALEEGEELRNDTIRNAVLSVDALVDEPLSNNEFDQRLAHLIEETTSYYGDSLGLMLGIGLFEEATDEDFSRGGKYLIAGTGTLEEDHTVGSVGAIRDKLRTAEKFGADYFFVPKDKISFAYEGLSNEEEATQVAQELELKFEIIPVATLEEALNYLEQMNDK